MALCGSRIFGGMARVSKGQEMAPGGRLPPEARRVLDAPSTWLFLVGLRPRRARLRFTGQDNYRTVGEEVPQTPTRRNERKTVRTIFEDSEREKGSELFFGR